MIRRRRSAVTVLAFGFALAASTPLAAQTTVKLAQGLAEVVFPVGQPVQPELSPADAELLRSYERAGHRIDHEADFHEVRYADEWFVASATLFDGSGVPVPSARCVRAPPPEMLKMVTGWRCRQVRTSGRRGTEVRYENSAGEIVIIRNFPHAGRAFMLMHVEQGGGKAGFGARSRRRAFFNSFRISPEG